MMSGPCDLDRGKDRRMTTLQDPLAPWRYAALADLCVHLKETHHARLREDLPRLAALMDEAGRVPGPHQAALQGAAVLLARFAKEIRAHMDYEERVVFPLIAGIESGLTDRADARRLLSEHSLDLETAHVGTGSDLDELHRICDTVAAPAETEPALGELFELFGRIIADTHVHVEKENLVLIPRALALLAGTGT
jgi:regulator of cell morphogenesis and NO signaling